MKRFARSLSILALLVPFLVPSAFAQTQPQEPTAASLFEQGKFAEEQERDFAKAATLYLHAARAALAAKDQGLSQAANDAAARVQKRAAGIASGQSQDATDALTCRMAERLYDLARYGSQTDEQLEAYRDLALLGALAVPWLEKAIQAPYELCGFPIRCDPPLYVRALAQMSAPEGIAALERMLSSSDPIARRSVAQYAESERHRAILLRALKDPAEAVRDAALSSLARSEDPLLFETMAAFARKGAAAGTNWLRVCRPAELVRIGASTDVVIQHRRKALEQFKSADNFVPDAATIDALLSLARTPGDQELRTAAMDDLLHGISRSWKPVAPELLLRIEAALLAEPDAYPAQYLWSALNEVGTAKSLPLLVERTTPEQINALYNTLTRILGASGPADYSFVMAAFAKLPSGLRGISTPNDAASHALSRWLEATADNGVSTAEIAKAAKGLPAGNRRTYIDRVVTGWLQSRTSSEAALATLPKLDPAFVDLLRELLVGQDSNQRGLAIRALGATGDPKVLPELAALVRESQADGTVVEAVRRITRNDPQRARIVLQLFLGRPSLGTEEFAQAVSQAIENRRPDEILAAVNAAWTPANADRLLALVAHAVPGPEGSKFLVAHYGELDAAAAATRMSVIKRLGQDLYEPALDLLGSALRDPNERVRSTAGNVFERFKQEQQRVADFEAWRASERESQQTVTDLLPLLDSANPDVVIGAVKALAGLKARSCTPKLVGLLEKHKGNEAVKAAVLEAIDRLGG